MNGRHRVRTVTLRVEFRDDGWLRFTSPDMPGWASSARTPHDLARTMLQARTEAEVAAYARWRGRIYDQHDTTLDGKPDPLDTPPRPSVRGERRDVHPLESWQPLPDGSWRSPSGQVWGRNTRLARRLLAKARDRGLPVPP